MRSPTSPASPPPADGSNVHSEFGRRILRSPPHIGAMGRVLIALSVIGATWFVWDVATADTAALNGTVSNESTSTSPTR